MNILLIFFTVHLISAEVEDVDVTGYSGQSLLVNSWKTWHENETKYMEKLNSTSMIDNRKRNQWINEGRFTLLRDNYTSLMIFIKELIIEDAGTYRISVGRRWSINMTLNVVEDSCCNVSKRVTVNNGKPASFSCEYSRNHINVRKIIFKKGKDSVTMVYGSWYNIGRFSGSDDKQKNLYNVRLTDVTPDDGGVYLCGVLIYKHSYSYSIVNTVHLHIMTKVGVSSVSGYSGAGLMIKCEHPQHKTETKYICKESAGCSGVQEKWMKNGDVSLHDDTREGVLMVFFRELKAVDAGTYRCGVKESEYTERFTQLQLIVKHDAKYPEVLTESVDLGGEVNISCQIPEEQKANFCKEDDHQSCQIMRTSAKVFTINMTDLRGEDSGIYWCGVYIITELNLKVKQDFSIILICSVCVIALLIAGFTLTVCTSRNKRRSDAALLPTIPSDETAVVFQMLEESLSEASGKMSFPLKTPRSVTASN